MARPKDSIQKLFDKGFSPEEIVNSGKYTQEEIDSYLNDTSPVKVESNEDADINSDTKESDTKESDTSSSSGELSSENLRDLLDDTGEEAPEMEMTNFNPSAGATVSSTERGYTQLKNEKHIEEVAKNYEPVKHGDGFSTDPTNISKSPDGIVTKDGEGTANILPNPGLVNATDDKKKEAAERLYDRIVVPVYEKLCQILPLTCKFPENKVRKLSAKDEIDLEMLLTFFDAKGDLKESTLREIIAEHNQEADKAFAYDEQFITDARSPTIREFIKRGWGIAEDDELKWILIEKAIDLIQNVIMLNLKKYAVFSEAKLFVLERNKEKRESEKVSNPIERTVHEQRVAQTQTVHAEEVTVQPVDEYQDHP